MTLQARPEPGGHGATLRPSGRASARPFCCARRLPGGWVLPVWLCLSACYLSPPSPQVAQFAVEGLETRAPTVGANQLGLRVLCRSPLPVQAQLRWVRPGGGRSEDSCRVDVPAGRGCVDVPYMATMAGVHQLSVRLVDTRNGLLLYRADSLRVVVRPAWEFAPDRSLYTREPVLRWRVRRNRDDLAAARVQVVWQRLAPPTTGSPAAAAAETVLADLDGRETTGALSTAAAEPGDYALTARLLGSTGVVDTAAVVVSFRSPASREVKIDQFSQSLLVDGVPFFPIGLYWLRADDLAAVRALGFNSADYYYRLQSEQVADLMDAAARSGMQVLVELSDHIRNLDAPDVAAIDALVDRYRSHPALLAWYLIDEPAESGVSPEVTRRLYERLRQRDPYHPVLVVNNRPSTYAAHGRSCDLLAIDVYPVPNSPVSRVRERMDEAWWATGGSRPVWLIAQAFGGTEHWPRPPTTAELRNMVFQGLVHGARGIFFYRYCTASERNIQPQPLWEEVQRLAGELRGLAPVLVEPAAAEQAWLADGEPGVDLALRRYAGDYYLFAVNTTLSTRRVSISLERLPPITRAEGLGRSGPADLQRQHLRLELAALGTGVYLLEAHDSGE